MLADDDTYAGVLRLLFMKYTPQRMLAVDAFSLLQPSQL